MGDTSFRARYEAGETIHALAEDTGLSYGTVHTVLEAEGVTFEPRGAAPAAQTAKQRRVRAAERRQALAAELLAAYDKGATIEDLAAQHERSYGWAHGLLREAGTVMRARGPQQKNTS